jgi:hypothetical protein
VPSDGDQLADVRLEFDGRRLDRSVGIDRYDPADPSGPACGAVDIQAKRGIGGEVGLLSLEWRARFMATTISRLAGASQYGESRVRWRNAPNRQPISRRTRQHTFPASDRRNMLV